MADLAKESRKSVDRVEFDTVLVDEVGQAGTYQLKILAMVSVAVIFTGLGMNEYVFTAARISTRCLIPECDGAYPEFAPAWIQNAIPGSDSSFEECERYVNTNASFDETCPAEAFSQETQPCDEYVYESTGTVVFDFNLGCDEWRRSLIGSIITFGSLCALPIVGYVSDRYGRATALSIAAFNTAWMGCTRYFASNYVGFVISNFAESVFGSGVLSSAYMLVMEVLGPKYRKYGGAIMNSAFSVGQIALGFVAWGVPYWRNLTLALYVPQLISIIYFWILPESVRWLMSKGHYEIAEQILNNMARVNGKSLSPKSMEGLRTTAEDERTRAGVVEDEPWLPVLVFRYKPILLRCMVMPILWISMTFVYYGMSVNAVNLSGNSYLNYISVASIDIPGFFGSAFFQGVVGRKIVIITSFWICAVCQISFIFIPSDLYGLSLAVYLLGKLCVAAVGTAVYVFTAELYPTKYRHSLFAFASMMGRIGSILAPLTPALGSTVWEYLPFVLFAGMSSLAGLLCFLMPETLGTKLPDTMEEAAALGKKAKSTNK